MSKFKPNAQFRAPRPVARRSSVASNGGGTAVLTTSEHVSSTASAPIADEEMRSPNGLQRIGFNVLLLYIFFRFSFLHEFISGKVGVDTHIILVLSLLLYACALGSGHLGEAFRDKICWMWLGFGLCMSLATMTSYWRGGSMPLLIDYLRTALPVIVIIPALTSTKKDIGRLVNVIGVACITTVILGLINNDFKTGRMGIATAGSEIQDSNDYAAHLILMLPALAYLTMRPGKPIFVKATGAVFIAASMYEILSTGSRGGLLSIALTTLFVLFTGTTRIRMLILVGVPVLALLAIPFIPSESAARLKSLFSKETGAQSEEATESAQARMALLQRSLDISIHHPLLGVGPGQFMDYDAENAKQQGERGMWHVTHNAYTQVSSECGIPALLFFLSALAMTFSVFRQASKRASPLLAVPSAMLTIMLVGFGICIFFLSLAYSVQMVVLGAIAICIRSLLRNEPIANAKELAAA